MSKVLLFLLLYFADFLIGPGDPSWGGAKYLPVLEQHALDLSLDGSTPPESLRPQGDVKKLGVNK